MGVAVLFVGEMMTCVMCGAQKQSMPHVESGWRAVQMDADVFYVCPDELPRDGASVEEYKIAYDRVLTKCLEVQAKRQRARCN
jgi:hypothetical protein